MIDTSPAAPRLDVRLPFSGFYETVWSHELDHEESSFVEYRTENHDKSDKEQEAWWPERLRLDAEKLHEILSKVTDQHAAREAIAKDFVPTFDAILGEAMGLSVPTEGTRYCYKTQTMVPHTYDRDTVGLELKTFTSARGNYTTQTDWIHATIPLPVVELLFIRSRIDWHKRLRELIDDDGHDPDEELASPLTDWCQNSCWRLLTACLPLYGVEEIENQCATAMAEESEFHRAWSNAVDWKKFEAERTEARAEPLADWIEDDLEAVAHWRVNHPDEFAEIVASVPHAFYPFAEALSLGTLSYHCPETPDLFECAA
ncbi:hypothetical protein J2045_003361 [Peteryoungia aggregata LMG 23059]|uniref:Uncharacterized protein n=1 Tax=Peteryoungia aggregata LMG 23059 TaxID=1368425 RepID=A0ABU0GAD3_9HYPH|nr:hypothetical protein [Peteryoungia aggregata]MDQ0422313.1 hypothetical protein [Peteryoungia aggregata LMG 23059]